MRTEPYQTWLITGASSGLGKAIAAEALIANHRVIGTTRDVEKAESSYPEFTSNGGIWTCLDPAQHDAYERFSEVAVEYNVDVLVNSAGYAFIGAVEDTRYAFHSIPFHDIFNINFGVSTAMAKPSLVKKKSAPRWKSTSTAPSGPRGLVYR